MNGVELGKKIPSIISIHYSVSTDILIPEDITLRKNKEGKSVGRYIGDTFHKGNDSCFEKIKIYKNYFWLNVNISSSKIDGYINSFSPS